MGEKMHSSSCDCIGESSKACFHGCCAKPSFLSLPNDSSQAHNHSPKSSNTNTNIASSSQYNFIVATLSSLQPNTTHFTNHESLPPLNNSYSYFIESFPQFSNTQLADQIRSREYYHLALSNHVCLDYVGHSLFSDNTNVASSSSSSIDHPSFFELRYKAVNLNSQLLLGGQESLSELEAMMRKRIMDFMNISEEDYTMVFTSNQSSAFKTLADSYPFQSNRNLLTVYDYKSEALEIMAEGSKRRGARVSLAEFSWPRMRLQSRKLRKIIVSRSSTKVRTNHKGLFVFPLQSRMTGSRYSYQWMSIARENGWHVLLDACALGPKDMETLGLSLFKPDFLICSFYKVFGQNPSGFGCLFIKKSSSSTLLTDSNTSTTIGIVNLVPQSPVDLKSTLDDGGNNNNDKVVECSEIEELETNIKCNISGLDHADSLGLIMISTRSRCLINWLVNALSKLEHPHSENGNPLVRIYGPKIGFDRGPSLAFNVFDWKGEKVDPKLVQKLADRNNISLSYGFLENISFVDKSEEDRERRVEIITSYDNDNNNNNNYDDKYQSGICAITATLGLVTNFEDIYRVWAFIARFLDADFVEKERWRYMALNQTTIEV